MMCNHAIPALPSCRVLPSFLIWGGRGGGPPTSTIDRSDISWGMESPPCETPCAVDGGLGPNSELDRDSESDTDPSASDLAAEPSPDSQGQRRTASRNKSQCSRRAAAGKVVVASASSILDRVGDCTSSLEIDCSA
jgi:hypothetical protein